jgi:hypothetical protein
MNDLATYSWLPFYLSAVLETDNSVMPSRIYEALAAIKQRLLSPIESGGIEYRAIDDAERGLLTLRAERVGDGSALERCATRAGRQSEGIC